MRNSSVVNANLAGSCTKPGEVRRTISGAANMPTMVIATRNRPSKLATWLIKALVASGVRCLRYSERIGTNAWLNAPSPEIRRSRLGILNATKNASVAMPAPKIRAISVSRTKPSRREINVMPPTVASALSKFINDGKYAPSSIFGSLSLTADCQQIKKLADFTMQQQSID